MKTPSATYRRRSALLFLSAGLAAFAVGCSGAENGDEDARDEGAVSVREANDLHFSLKEHVLKRVPASAASKEKLGIATWDVFAGVHEGGFRGTVFFASDDGGDVKYVFAVDLEAKVSTFLMLAKDGSKLDATIEIEKQSQLLADVKALRKRLEALPSEGPSCAAALAAAGVTVVVTIGFLALQGATVGLLDVAAAPIVMGVLHMASLNGAVAFVRTYGMDVLNTAMAAPSACMP